MNFCENIVLDILTKANLITDNINLEQEKLEKRRSGRLLHKKFEEMLKTLKYKPKKKGYPYYVIKYLRNGDLTQWIKMQDIISYVVTNKEDCPSDRKRPLATFLNEKTNGYWEIKTEKKDKYYKFNPELNKAIIQQTGGTHFDKKTKKELLKRANNKCELCYNSGTKKFLHADHWNNRADGGNGTFENGVILCQQCNNRKKNKNPDKVLYDYLKKHIELNNRSGNPDSIEDSLKRILLYHQDNNN
jgi:5-methylcytosine-specific restriction endonuclease McrA